MSEELKLQRTREQWAKCEPKLMAQQSQAAVMYALQDAKRDVDALYRHADKISAELAALKAGQGEAVAWEYRTHHDNNTVTPGWDAWERVQTNARYTGETVASRVAEIQDYIDRGYRYELRALYAAPPASADAVSVPRELLESLLERYDSHALVRSTMSRVEELRALLAQSQEVKS